MSSDMPNTESTANVLKEILSSLKSLQHDHRQLVSTVDAINARVNSLAGVKQSQDGVAHDTSLSSPKLAPSSPSIPARAHHPRNSVSSIEGHVRDTNGSSQSTSPPPRRSSTTSKIILTSYPGQAGVDPLPMRWGAKDPSERGRQ